ncbi:MAG TPA: response regulator transcription factor [Bryobacteraceae bacterium]|nr:response regulator transcription factor [Bryobacteraceae bacterium]
MLNNSGADTKSRVAVCDTQPVTAEGVRLLLSSCEDLEFSQTIDSLALAFQLAHTSGTEILVVDKALGTQPILENLAELKTGGTGARVVVWGVSITESEALRFLQAGARGIVRKTAQLNVLLACLRTVATGRSWMEDCVFRESARSDRNPRSELTRREQQVMELVEQGFKNKEIARELSIRPGTVKIHLKHIFEKTGVRGRYGLALTGLREKGVLSLTA